MGDSSFWRGFMAGAALPVLLYVLLYYLYEVLGDIGWMSDQGYSTTFRIRTIGLLAIIGNMLLIPYFRKRFMYDRVRGVVIATFVWTAIWVVRWSSLLF